MKPYFFPYRTGHFSNPYIVTLIVMVLSYLSVTAQEAQALKTVRYSVPASFLPYCSQFVADPSPENWKDAGFVQSCLEGGGVTFGEGASASYDAEKSVLTVTNKESEILVVENLLALMRMDGESQIGIVMEWIEVDHLAFSDWLFENRITEDGTELRNEVQKWIKEDRAAIIESATVAGRSGQRAKVESVDEYVYPTEYDPSEIPNKVTLKDGAESVIAAVTPTAFETRNLGTTLEADPVIGPQGLIVDINLAPEIVELEGTQHWHHKQTNPKFQIHQPTFYMQKITTSVNGLSGRYIFLGATRPLKPSDPKRSNPIVLQFVRGDVSSTSDWRRLDENE